ncbi:CCDC19 [Symbiodinium sp. CCMP2592]|nr:CCDC19 [Symbiodinium sp. CCMP2592]
MPACGDVINQVAAEHPQLAELRSVTVLGITGSTLLEAATVSSMQDLNQQVQAKLKAKSCCCLTADGQVVTKLGQISGEPLTAVAKNVHPFLQLAGLEDEHGNLASDLCSMKDLEDVALQVAVRLAETACWFMGPGHLCGYPTVAWDWDDVLAAPRERFSTTRIGGNGARQHMRVDFWSVIVPPGVRVIVSIRAGSPSSEAARDFVTLQSLAVQDIVDIRRAHQRACDSHREEILATRSQADTVDALIMLLGSLRKLTGEWLAPCYRSRSTSTERLREYTVDLVHFEVFHDVYNSEAEGYW